MPRVFQRRMTWRRMTLLVVEHLCIVLAVGAAVYIRVEFFGGGGEMMAPAEWVPRAVLIGLVVQVCLHYADLYDLRTLSDRRDLVVGLVQALGAASLVLALLYYWLPDLVIGRGVFLLSAAIIITFVAGWRMSFEWLSLKAAPAERLLLVGTNAAAVSLAKELYERRNELGVEIVGFVDDDPDRVGAPVFNPSVIGSVADIPTIVREHHVDRVVVSLADARGRLPMDVLLGMKLKDGVAFDHLASVYEQYTGKIAVENLRPSWFIFSQGFKKSWFLTTAKRLVDVVAASVGLAVAAPIMLLVGLAVKLTSAGPALYHQQRVGQDGAVFTVHKFRSMRQDAEAGTGAVWASSNDDRVTPVGRFLRKTRLDELPQLWNVLLGDMSLVGPRPERPEFVEKLTELIPFYGQRHVVKPGLTGWAQVRYAYGSSVEDALEKLQYDLFYIKNLSPALDVFILLETAKTVLLRRGT